MIFLRKFKIVCCFLWDTSIFHVTSFINELTILMLTFGGCERMIKFLLVHCSLCVNFQWKLSKIDWQKLVYICFLLCFFHHHIIIFHRRRLVFTFYLLFSFEIQNECRFFFIRELIVIAMWSERRQNNFTTIFLCSEKNVRKLVGSRWSRRVAKNSLCSYQPHSVCCWLVKKIVRDIYFNV